MAEQKWGYEGEGKDFDGELNSKVLWGSLIVVVVLSLGAMILMRGMFGFALGQMEAGDPPPSPRVEAAERRMPPAPNLQDHPESELEEMRVTDAHQLEAYTWEDQEAGLVRVPIERAMEMVVDQGLPSWPEVDANQDPATGGDQ